MAGDTAAAVDFLRRWEPEGPWVLSAVVPDGKIETFCFTASGGVGFMERWIDHRQGEKNIYFSVNRPRTVVRKKMGKGDVGWMLALHVDCDPEAGIDIEMERVRLERMLVGHVPPPSVVVFTGGGYQGYWLLDAPVEVAGRVEELEAYNVQVMRDLGADHCFNIDRIMRVPGTVNLPDAKKRAAGRVPEVAAVVSADWGRRYRLEDLTAAPIEVAVVRALSGNGSAAVWPRAMLPPRVREVIGSGESGEWGGDRSAAVWYVCRQMVRHGFEDGEIAEVISTSANGISAHVLDKGGRSPLAFAMRQVRRARESVGLPPWADWDEEGEDVHAAANGHDVAAANGHDVVMVGGGGGNVVALAKERERRDPPQPPQPPTPPGGALLPPQFSDDALALRFSERHKDRLRYVAVWGKWMLWNGARWIFEEILLAYDLARPICREAAAMAEKDGFARSLTSAKTINAVVSIARSDARHAKTTDAWDTDTGAINTPGGTWDEYGMHGHRQEDYITKITAVAAGDNCPGWLAFLTEITDGDAELQDYLQRVAGYCLTGSTIEHVMFFLYGTGANGKGVFINTLVGIWGDYATVSPMETFIEVRNEAHPTELAFLRGARLVAAQETEQGRRWAESKIKTLTGGDAITARFMRQDFFTFKPQFKLMIAGNHKPSLRGVDEAIKRRIHLVPFTVTIPKDRRNSHLLDDLREEWPGILKWALDGLASYREIGLSPPTSVLEATEQYFSNEDAFGTWLEEECRKVDVNKWCSSASLWDSWKLWAEHNNERYGNRKGFAENLRARGFPSKAIPDRGHLGIEVRNRDIGQAVPRRLDEAPPLTDDGR